MLIATAIRHTQSCNECTIVDLVDERDGHCRRSSLGKRNDGSAGLEREGSESGQKLDATHNGGEKKGKDSARSIRR